MDASVFLSRLFSNKKNGTNVKSFQAGSVLPSMPPRVSFVNPSLNFKYDPLKVLASLKKPQNSGIVNNNPMNKPIYGVSDIFRNVLEYKNQIDNLQESGKPLDYQSSRGLVSSSDNDVVDNGNTNQQLNSNSDPTPKSNSSVVELLRSARDLANLKFLNKDSSKSVGNKGDNSIYDNYSDGIKKILSSKDEQYKLAEKFNLLNLLTGSIDKFINDLAALRYARSIKPYSYSGLLAGAFEKAKQIDPSLASNLATLLYNVHSSGRNPLEFKDLYYKTNALKEQIAQQNAESRYETQRKNLMAALNVTNANTEQRDKIYNANIELGNKIKSMLYEKASNTSALNAQKIAEFLNAIAANKYSKIESDMALVKFRALMDYLNRYAGMPTGRIRFETDYVSPQYKKGDKDSLEFLKEVFKDA